LEEVERRGGVELMPRGDLSEESPVSARTCVLARNDPLAETLDMTLDEKRLRAD